jgi:ribosome-associated translation inhibitor RaiA
MRVSIDAAVEKTTKQLRRLRDKVQDHKAAMKYVQAERSRGSETEQ